MRGRRLRSRHEFERVFRSGRSLGNRLVAVHFLARQGPTRVGVAVSRRVGGAVMRNRARRRVREAVRRLEDRLQPGWDVVVVARREAVMAPFGDLAGAIELALERAGVAVAPK